MVVSLYREYFFYFLRMLTKEKIRTGIDVKAGARGTFLKFFNDQTTIPIFNKRAQLFQKCFGAADGPASAILDNGDGTFTSAAGESRDAFHWTRC